jgi:hypothetical protein
MKTQTTLGSFISLIQTLAAAQPRYSTNVAYHTQSEVAPLLPLLRFTVISWSREIAEGTRTSCRVFRFSSSNASLDSKASSSSSHVPSYTLGVLRLAH